MVAKGKTRVVRDNKHLEEDRFYCEICGKGYSSEDRATECEAQGDPDFWFNVGDILEVMLGGKKRKVEIRGRYPSGHHAMYLQGDFSNISEYAIKKGFLKYLHKNPNSVEDMIVDEEGSSRARAEYQLFIFDKRYAKRRF